MIDLYTSRRDKFLECKFWSQDKNPYHDISDAEIVYNISPSGTFYAKELNPYTISNQVIAESFMLESKSVSLFTEDGVDELRENDIVEFDDEVYRVDEIQVVPYKKQRQFLRGRFSCGYIISLRG